MQPHITSAICNPYFLPRLILKYVSSKTCCAQLIKCTFLITDFWLKSSWNHPFSFSVLTLFCAKYEFNILTSCSIPEKMFQKALNEVVGQITKQLTRQPNMRQFAVTAIQCQCNGSTQRYEKNLGLGLKQVCKSVGAPQTKHQCYLVQPPQSGAPNPQIELKHLR